jgi:hypothetical protein
MGDLDASEKTIEKLNNYIFTFEQHIN